MFEINDVIGFDALYESMSKCKRGVLWKSSVASYILNAMERTLSLTDDLETGAYKPRTPDRFTIRHPKEREIISIPFPGPGVPAVAK